MATISDRGAVMDYETGEALEGGASDALILASEATETGAVGAYRDAATGIWQHVPDADEARLVALGETVTVVYVDGAEVEVDVHVGDVVDVADDDDEDDEDDDDPLNAYVAVDVTIDGEEHRVGTMVGVRESLHGTVRAAGCGVRPHCDAWQIDSSDLESVPRRHREAVRGALSSAAYRLWLEAEAMREDAAA